MHNLSKQTRTKSCHPSSRTTLEPNDSYDGHILGPYHSRRANRERVETLIQRSGSVLHISKSYAGGGGGLLGSGSQLTPP